MEAPRRPSGTPRRGPGRSGPGPVHLNLAFREPLTGDVDALARPTWSGGASRVHGPRHGGWSWNRSEGVGIVVAGGSTTRTARRHAGARDLAAHLRLAGDGGSPVALPAPGNDRRGRCHRADCATPARHRGHPRPAVVVEGSRDVSGHAPRPRVPGHRGRSLVAVVRPGPSGHGVPPVRSRTPGSRGGERDGVPATTNGSRRGTRWRTERKRRSPKSWPTA